MTTIYNLRKEREREQRRRKREKERDRREEGGRRGKEKGGRRGKEKGGRRGKEKGETEAKSISNNFLITFSMLVCPILSSMCNMNTDSSGVMASLTVLSLISRAP